MPYTGPDETFAELVKDDPAINVTVDDLENGDQFRNLGARRAPHVGPGLDGDQGGVNDERPLRRRGS